MADLGSELLEATLGFVRARAEQLLGVAATDADALLAAAGLPPAGLLPAVKTQIEGHLNDAKNDVSLAGTDLGNRDFANAATHTAQAANALDQAARAAGADDSGVLALFEKAFGGAGAGALAQKLGLGGPGQLTTAKTSLVYTVPASAPVPPLDAAGLLSVTNAALSAVFDYGPTPDAVLTVKLSATIKAGLSAEPLIQILAGGAAGVTADIVVSIDTAHGVTLGAGARNRITLPGQLDAGVLNLRDLALGLAPPATPGAGPAGLELSGTLAGSLAGVIEALVDGAGVRLAIDAGAIDVGVLPPDGAGLTVNAGPVRGGGFLLHHDATYGGALDLTLGPVEFTAVGLIVTSPFSLVVVIGFRVQPGIQLSFGFTLNAVGGVLALDRAVSRDALVQSVEDHSVDGILFPADPVGSAPTILQTLATIFPADPGGFVIGPMVELGWGTPISFVTGRLGIIISLPDLTIALVGSVELAVPAPEAPIVYLRADVIVEITPDELCAVMVLAGSWIAGFGVSGSFGLLINWGDDPQIAFSAGGFHPHYPPPRGLEKMSRISVDLSPPSILTLRTESYVALTTNSFQLGALTELRAMVDGTGAEGHIGFDALVLWAPTFHFEIDLNAGITVYVEGESLAGIDLALHLEGPGPWEAQGTATISILFIDIDFDVGPITWGSGDPTPPPTTSPVDAVAAAVALPAAWAAQLPPDTDMLVRFRADDGGAVVVHPLGGFEVRQRAVPLETKIDRMGRYAVSEPEVSLGAPTVGANTLKTAADVSDRFAPGEYLDLTNDEKLSRPAFESFPAGIRMAGSDGISSGTPCQTELSWYTVFPNDPELVAGPKVKFLFGDLVPFMLTSAQTRHGVAGRSPYAEDRQQVTMADPGLVTVRRADTLQPVASAPPGPVTTTAAARIVAAADPSEQAQTAGLGVAA
jgi:hypothetical protein